MAGRRMTHRCAGRPGCQTHIGMTRLMCGSCWNTVPKPLRDEIMRTWNPRGGIRQSDEYHAAVTAARKYLAPPSPQLPPVAEAARAELVTWCRIFATGPACAKPCDDCRRTSALNAKMPDELRVTLAAAKAEREGTSS